MRRITSVRVLTGFVIAVGLTLPTAGQAGIGVTGSNGKPADPVSADLAQIEADLAANRRR